ncbi:MAG: 2,3-diphosphoglycerate-dependent phosphoglycerate mutase [Alphaproteobacteria bacterium]|nr:2,3-diphosphoglycerate-dependent phosphoglycerate mutase [Alphaproteobacteria bacterium]
MSKRPQFDFAIIRHGQSEANRQNIFTGWRDSPLSDQGVSEARASGRLLKQEGFHFDIAFTSLQSRAIKTLWLVLEEMDLMWIPVRKHWELNERHYGALQGKNKIEAVEKFGAEQVNKWRRGYAVQPPFVALTDPDYPKFDARYAGVPEAMLPRGESLKDVSDRVLPFWLSEILPLVRSGKRVLVAAHGNSLRALLKHLERMSEAEIEAVNIPTGLPKIYTLDADGLAKTTSYVGDPADVQARIQSVANQTKKG